MDKKPPLTLVTGTKPVTAGQIRQKLLDIAPDVIDRLYGITVGLEDDTHLKPLQTLFGAITKLRLDDDPVAVPTNTKATAEGQINAMLDQVRKGDITLTQAERMTNIITQRLELSEAEKLRELFDQKKEAV